MLLLLFSAPGGASPPDDTSTGGSPVVCERCGFRVKPRKLRKEWTGYMVCGQCFDPRPADTRPPRIRPEGLPLKNVRLEPPPIFRDPGDMGGDDL